MSPQYILNVCTNIRFLSRIKRVGHFPRVENCITARYWLAMKLHLGMWTDEYSKVGESIKKTRLSLNKFPPSVIPSMKLVFKISCFKISSKLFHGDFILRIIANIDAVENIIATWCIYQIGTKFWSFLVSLLLRCEKSWRIRNCLQA